MAQDCSHAGCDRGIQGTCPYCGARYCDDHLIARSRDKKKKLRLPTKTGHLCDVYDSGMPPIHAVEGERRETPHAVDEVNLTRETPERETAQEAPAAPAPEEPPAEKPVPEQRMPAPPPPPEERPRTTSGLQQKTRPKPPVNEKPPTPAQEKEDKEPAPRQPTTPVTEPVSQPTIKEEAPPEPREEKPGRENEPVSETRTRTEPPPKHSTEERTEKDHALRASLNKALKDIEKKSHHKVEGTASATDTPRTFPWWLAIIVIVALLGALGYYFLPNLSFSTTNEEVMVTPEPNETVTAPEPEPEPQYRTVDVPLSFAKYTRNPVNYDDLPGTLRGQLLHELQGTEYSGRHRYYIADDEKRKIELLQLSSEQRDLFIRDNRTEQVYEVKGIFSYRYGTFALEVTSIDPSQRDTEKELITEPTE